MSSSQYNPADVTYWSSPRLKKTVNGDGVNIDLNHNIGDSLKSAQSVTKSFSELSSPQLWHKGSTRCKRLRMIRKDAFISSSKQMNANISDLYS